jgi:hypothetical protein
VTERVVNRVNCYPSRAKDGGYIYFARCLSPELQVKIGIASDLASRMSSLRNGCPYEIVLVAYYWNEDPASEERRMHQRYAESRLRGEWFASSPLIEDDIAVIADVIRTGISRLLASVSPSQ